MSDEVKRCPSCRWCDEDKYSPHRSLCTSERVAPFDVALWGRQPYQTYVYCLDARGDNGACGVEGKHFEPKPPQQEPPRQEQVKSSFPWLSFCPWGRK